jgi:type VI secretion system protein ImpE
MGAKELFQAGRLQEAIQALGAEVRDNPTDSRRRTFLFELLCFAGQFERARKQLNALAKDSVDTETGALLYRSALAAEQVRQDFFEQRRYPARPQESGSRPFAGILNGKPFHSLEDADPRVGPRLEVFVAGEYLWVPFEYVGSIEMEAPRQLRDLMWSAAFVTTGPAFKGKELGQVLLPMLSPQSWQHASDEVKLGRATEWQEVDGTPVPFGQKLLLVDDEEVIPFLEIRELRFQPAETDQAEAASPQVS